MLHIVHHHGYVAAAAPGSRFRFDKYGLVMEALRANGRPVMVHEPAVMPRAWIEAVHDPVYVEEVLTLTVPREKERRIGFPITEHTSARAQLSPGGTWAAAKLAIEHGYAANTAGGSHHALFETGAGYCVFNDLAIAAHRLLEEGDATRILILDLDVHQGDGTAALTAGRADIFTLSIHAERNFPVRKARSSRDVSLADGVGDETYLNALANVLPETLCSFAPDLILYQAGVDVHADDRLGRLSISDDGLRARDLYVASMARDHGIPLASTLGGGYGEDREAVARRHARSIWTLAEGFGLA